MTPESESRYPHKYPHEKEPLVTRSKVPASGGSRSKRERGELPKLTKASRRKRRTRSPHPGVVLIPPDVDGRHPNWRARFTDPDTGRLKKVTLDAAALPNADARRDWAIKKSKSIA